ncbi:hypothetical protein UT300016_33090 [Clostridium senegalense]
MSIFKNTTILQIKISKKALDNLIKYKNSIKFIKKNIIANGITVMEVIKDIIIPDTNNNFSIFSLNKYTLKLIIKHNKKYITTYNARTFPCIDLVTININAKILI